MADESRELGVPAVVGIMLLILREIDKLPFVGAGYKLLVAFVGKAEPVPVPVVDVLVLTLGKVDEAFPVADELRLLTRDDKVELNELLDVVMLIVVLKLSYVEVVMPVPFIKDDRIELNPLGFGVAGEVIVVDELE